MSEISTAPLLEQFAFERVLSSSECSQERDLAQRLPFPYSGTSTPSVYLLGTISGQKAIVHVLKANFDIPEQVDDDEAREKARTAVKEVVAFSKVVPIEDNDIVSNSDS